MLLLACYEKTSYLRDAQGCQTLIINYKGPTVTLACRLYVFNFILNNLCAISSPLVMIKKIQNLR